MRCQQNFPKRSVSTVFWSQADAVEHMSNGCLEWLWKFFSPPHNPFVKAKSRRRKGGDQCFKRNYHNGTSFQWWGQKAKKKKKLSFSNPLIIICKDPNPFGWPPFPRLIGMFWNLYLRNIILWNYKVYFQVNVLLHLIILRNIWNFCISISKIIQYIHLLSKKNCNMAKMK